MLERLARFVIRHRKLVVVGWLLLTILGAFSANQINKRWLDQFSIPGYAAYEANQRTLKVFGSGAQPPHVALFNVEGDVTANRAIPAALASFHEKYPDFRVGSYYSTKSRAYVSKDGHSTFATIYPPGESGFSSESHTGDVRDAIRAALPVGVEFHLTGRDALFDSQGSSEGPSVFTEALIGGAGALIILLFVFGTIPAVLMPIMIAIAAILNTFTLAWGLTYVTSVSRIVQFLIALVGLGVAIDYALLMIFRFREELRHGRDVETATIETMKHAGRSVIVSGSTVAIGLLSMVIIPIPVIRSIGIGGLLIPAVSVLVSITLMPAMFSLLGHRINSWRVMPRRIVEGTDLEGGFWWRWAHLVLRRPLLIGSIGLVIVGLLVYSGSKINAGEAQLRAERGSATDDAVIGYNKLVADGFSPGVAKPFVVLAEDNDSPAVLTAVVSRLNQTPGLAGAVAPPDWRKDGTALVETFPDVDAAADAAGKTASRLKHDVLPALERQAGGDTRLTLAGTAPEDRDFSRAVYSKFPWALAFVILLTFVLLMRAFRSIFLPLKAVILNLVSLIAAYGIIVFVFQEGHGSEAIWNVQATHTIISWIPLMIFAFLYGLSMDYEVFMLTRMREEYDEHPDTNHAVALGLARTGKLVTSAALVLMFAFFVLSTSPGPDIKQFGIGLAAGIIFDATVIRALLVPAIMRLAGNWNWWFPQWVGRALFVNGTRALPEPD
ncbi:MAG TPA: MMPL family transporter [Gaiellaceae bacterium]|nr:MMPL family transporter [Gaiellaceae bacterium]